MSIIETEIRRKRKPVDNIGAAEVSKERIHYFSDLPQKIQEDIRTAQRDVAAGNGISNEEVFRKTDDLPF
ncbi:MAG: hypothetical protein LBT89_10565 [Planctomycetaceae bacterium]|jgi:hypothetical protein|nr:hypothetical protein [Planctomycetaceae bacterium]